MWNLDSDKSEFRNPKSEIQRGFTLLELVVVVTIMGVAFSLVLPALGRGLRQWRLQGAVREIVTLMKFTRNQAVSRRVPLQVILDRSRHVYWLDNADTPVLSDPHQAEEKGIRLSALPAGLRFGEATVGGLRVQDRQVGIPFFPRGGSTGGEVQVLDDRGKGYRIRVDPMTGHAGVNP